MRANHQNSVIYNFRRNSALAVAAVVGISQLIQSRAASAAVDIWTGADGNGKWSDPLNWAAGVAPSANDFLQFAGVNVPNPGNDNLANPVYSGITFNAGSSPFTLGGSSVQLGFQMTNTGTSSAGDIVNASSNLQTISMSGITLNPGQHLITTGLGGLNINSALTVSTGAAMVFTTSGGIINVNGSGLTTSNGLLGGGYTIGDDWATLDGSNNVVPFSAFTDIAGNAALPNTASSNVRITTTAAQTSAALPASVTTINSLLLNPASLGNSTLTIGAGNTLVLGSNGGIYNPTQMNGASRTLTIGASVAAGGTLTAGDGTNPATITFSSAPFTSQATGNITINSAITDNGGSRVSVVYEGGYFTPGATTVNTYSGNTYILSGRVSQPTGNSFGSGSVYIFAGAEINPGAGAAVTLTNPLFIAGNGTQEGSGLGAIRAFNSAAFTTNIASTITLMDNASIDSNGNTIALINGGRNVAFTGQITGPGGLGIGSPVATSANGTGIVQLGSLTGTGVAVNNYAGNTTINGAAGGTSPAGIFIGNSADNNTMPHGTAGSYASGPTGNLILNSSNASRQAIFDLNGSTQTINGLLNTSTSPTSNFVQSNVTGGLLILGDSNASANYGGVLQDGPGQLNIQKIGLGTQTFSGASNTYTGTTTIQNGVLAITGSLANTPITLDTSLASPTLAGTGSVAGSVTMAANNGANVATIAPGATSAPGAIGTLTIGGGLTVNGGVMAFDLPATGPTDSIAANSLNLAGASSITLDPAQAGTYTLVTSGATIGTVPTLAPSTTRLTYSWDPNSFGQTPGGNNLIVDVTGSVANLNWAPANAAGVWDVNSSANWSGATPNTFFNSDNVTFADSPTPLTRNVSLNTTVLPGSVTVSTSSSYTISGSGSISGIGTLTKSGPGSLTLATANSYSGGTSLNLGTLNINNASAIGTGTLSISGGTIDNTSAGAIALGANNPIILNADVNFTGTHSLNFGTATVTLNNSTTTFNIAASTLSVGGLNQVAGTANIIKSGNGTLAINGPGTYTGTTTINSGGRIIMGDPAALGPTGSTNGGVTVNSGGTLDLSGIATTLAAPGFGQSVFTIAGNGADGVGAIVNNSAVAAPAGGANLLQHGLNNVTLSANASIGGTDAEFQNPNSPNNGLGRIDIGRDGGTLNLNGFTLTKSGGNQLNLAPNLTITPGNIVATGGILSFEGTVHDQNNVPGSNIIMDAGTTLQFTTVGAGNIQTPIIINGPGVQMGQTAAATSSIDSNFFLNSNLTVGPQNGALLATAILNLTGNITDIPTPIAGLPVAVATGVGSITKIGGQLLILSGSNSYSGGTTIAAGTLRLNSTTAFPTGTALTLGDAENDSATFDLNGNPATADSLSTIGTGTANDITSGGSTLTYAGGAINSVFHGSLQNGVALTVASGSLDLTGSSSNTGDTNVNAGTLTVDYGGAIGSTNAGVNVNVAANATLNVNGSISTATNLNTAGSVNFGANNSSGFLPRTLAALNIAGGVTTVDHSAVTANRSVLVLPGLSLSTGNLDLTNNDMIAHNGNLSMLTSLIAAGYNGGPWNGATGIISSTAASTTNTALAVEQNDNGSGDPLLSAFDGQAVVDSDVLIKYTYFGDANLDGVVNGSDYTLIDNGFNNTLTGWHNGDFNYDGIVNGDDYTLIDNAFNTQGPSLAGLPAAMVASDTAQIARSSSSSVPEPAAVTLLGLSAVFGLLPRYRKRAIRAADYRQALRGGGRFEDDILCQVKF